MRRIGVLAVFVVALVDMAAASVSAQMWPGGRYRNSSYDGFYDDGLVGALALNSANSTSRTTAQSYQAWSQRASSPQMSAVQGDVRGAMDASTQRRMEGIYDRQQANRDWWFQVNQQQMAQQQAAQQQADMRRYAAMPSGFEYAPPAAPAAAPKADTDIIKWLPLLQEPQFAAQRAQIEAPYRHAAQGLSRPTVEEYQSMITAAEQMKTTLKGMAPEMTGQEYLNAEDFIDQLISEAREQSKQEAAKKQ